jgi:hypothetical protein
MSMLETLRGRSQAPTAFERSQHGRKKIEMRFAHLKRILSLGRLRLRGPAPRTNGWTDNGWRWCD